MVLPQPNCNPTQNIEIMTTQTVFYDIASAPPLRTFAPNPWKTRFALNFKGIPYRTEWVDLPDISPIRQKLNCPATRTLPDGSPYYTLPILQDGKQVIGDTFEIALYLDAAYPDGPKLFRPDTTGLTAAFNSQVDTIFTKFIIFTDEQPFVDPAAAEKFFAKRFGLESFDALEPSAEQKEQSLIEFEAALNELSKAYKHTGGTTDRAWLVTGTDKAQSQHAPAGRERAAFLDGDGPAYADFIVGAWLKMFEVSAKPELWTRMRSWQDGHWGRVVDALDKWAKIQ